MGIPVFDVLGRRAHAPEAAPGPVALPPRRVEPAAASAAPVPRRSLGLGTRARIIAAFSALAAAFAAAFGLQLVRLDRMERDILELRDHQEEMHLALELEDAVRSEYARQARVLAGEEHAPPDGGRDETVATLVRELGERVDEPLPAGWTADIATATRGLDELFRAELADVAAGRSPEGAEQARFALLFQVEATLDRLFAFLRDESVAPASSVEALRRESLRLAIAFAIALPLFALGVAVLLARSIGRPLAVLGAGAARIADGDLDTRIALRGPGEFAALAEEFNVMAAALKSHQEQLLRSEKLASLGRLAAGVAHEMNNPLQVILGYLSLHRGQVRGELGMHLTRVEREASRCKEIVEGLLQLARAPAETPPVPVDLRALADDVVDALRVAMPVAPRLGVTGHAEALGNPARLRQVVFNLVKNAAEAAGPFGAVDVEVCSERRAALVIVSDTGPGIPAALRDRVFEPFFTTKPTGTGLGLALARAIAQAHGGDVELEPDLGGGARFTLRAPRHAEGVQP